MIKCSIILIFFPTLLIAQTQKKLDEFFKSHQAKGFNGNVLYSKNDKIIFTGNYGYSLIDEKVPLDNNSLFNLASCSKQFTAFSIVQLVEKGKINYDSKVSEIIIGFPYKRVTIEHLLHHTAGLADYLWFIGENWKSDKVPTNDDVIHYMIKKKPPTRFKPGEKFEYSNTGYLLLGSIIEKMSGLSFSEYLDKNIFKPAKMDRTRVYRRRYKPEKIDNCTEGYIYIERDNKYIKIDKDENSDYVKFFDAIVGDGTVNSTILDLEKWKHALRSNLLISEKSKQRMFTAGNVSKDYGYGLTIENSKYLGKIVSHTGSWAGYRAMTLYIPNSNEFYIVLNNNEYPNVGRLVDEMIEITGE